MKILVHVQTNKVGSKCEDEIDIPDEELEGLTDEEVESAIEEQAKEAAFNMLEWGWKKA